MAILGEAVKVLMEGRPEHCLWVQALHLEHLNEYPCHVTGREKTEQGCGPGLGYIPWVRRRKTNRKKRWKGGRHKVPQER
jgi:hypothetical protein